jgi:hypothetical protein
MTVEDPAITEPVREQEDTELLSSISATKGFEQVNENEYICILFDLMLYRYPDLTRRVFALMVSFFTRKRTLIAGLLQSKILESSKSIQTMNKIKNLHKDLSEYQSEMQFWIMNLKSSGQESKQKVSQIFETYADLCVKDQEKQKEDQIEEDF